MLIHCCYTIVQFNARLPFTIDFVYVSTVSVNITDIHARVEKLSGTVLA
jgi:hypothetical protein